MAHEKQYLLADKIISQTLKNQLEWEATPSANSFSTTLSSYLLRLTETESDDQYDEDGPLNVYTVTLYDGNGEIVERFDDEILYKEITKYRPASGINYYSSFKSLFSIIKRQVLRLDEKLDEAIAALEEGNKF